MKDSTQYKTEVRVNPKAEKAKKEMKESGALLTIAGIVFVGGWLVRKYLLNDK